MVARETLDGGALAGIGDLFRVQQRHRVHLDVLVDDEFHAHQPDSIVGQKARLEGKLRVAEVHHDLGRRARHAREVGALGGERYRSPVHLAYVSLRAGNRYLRAVRHGGGRAFRADHRGNAQLARHDRGVAGAAAAIGDDGRGALHDRLPVGGRRVGDEHLPRPEFRKMAGAGHDADLAAGNLLSDGSPPGQDIAAALDLEGLQHLAATLRSHRLRPRLNQI